MYEWCNTIALGPPGHDGWIDRKSYTIAGPGARWNLHRMRSRLALKDLPKPGDAKDSPESFDL